MKPYLFALFIGKPFMEKADYLIIGGGIMGCALFYALSNELKGKIILLEQNQIASKITGQSGGFIRKINTDPYLSQLSYESFDHYQYFNKEASCGFVNTGLYHTVSYAMLAQLHNNLADIISENYPVTITRSSTDKALIHEVKAGFIDTQLTCTNWVKAATRRKAECFEHVQVKNILINNGTAYGVNTTRGVITCDRVILTTGALSNLLLSPIGISSPLQVKSFQYNIYPQQSRHLNTAHLNMLDQFYLFPNKKGNVLAGFLHEDKLTGTQNVDNTVDESLALSLHQQLCTQFSWPKNSPYFIKKSFDAYTPDQYGVMKQSSIKGLFLATGLSSGGIKIAPALAKRFIQILKV